MGFAVALAAMVVAAATEPMFPALMKPLLDQGFVARSGFPLWFVPVALVGIFVSERDFARGAQSPARPTCPDFL